MLWLLDKGNTHVTRHFLKVNKIQEIVVVASFVMLVLLFV